MQQVKVSELASEFEMKNAVVMQFMIVMNIVEVRRYWIVAVSVQAVIQV